MGRFRVGPYVRALALPATIDLCIMNAMPQWVHTLRNGAWFVSGHDLRAYGNSTALAFEGIRAWLLAVP
jgi:hypothetical protein